MKRTLLLSLVILTSVALTGCAGMVIGAGSTVGVAAVQERGMSGAIDDAKIRADINTAWIRHDAQMFRKVDLNVYEGRVMLTGVVLNADQRDEAVRLTWQVLGVRAVLNEIVIDPAGQGLMDYSHDTVLQEKMQAKLLFDRDIKNVNYQINVVAGVIYILGVAQDQAEYDRVLAQASDISGVKRVISHILLKSDPQRVR